MLFHPQTAQNGYFYILSNKPNQEPAPLIALWGIF